MNKTLLIILGLAVAIGVAFFVLTSDRDRVVPQVVTVPAVQVPTTSAPTTPTTATPAASTPTPAAAAPALDPESVVAIVNGAPIKQGALDQGVQSIVSQYANLYKQMGQDFASMLVGADGFSMRLGIQAQALDRLVFDAIAKAEVASRGIAVTEDELDVEFAKQYDAFLESNNLTEETLAAILTSQGMTIETFKTTGRSNIREGLLMKELQIAVAGTIELTEDEIQTFWEKNSGNYSTPEQIRASHILVKTEDEAKAVLAQLEGGADFATLAKEKSTDTVSGQKGGDLDFFGRGTMVTEFEDAAFALQTGQRSGIVQTEYGYHIILVTDKKAATAPTLTDVKDQVVADAKQEIVDERSNAWYAEVMAAADVVVNDPLLHAARQQKINVDLGLAAYEAIRDAGEVDEPYVFYVIGTLYESKVQNLMRAKTQLEAAETPDTAKIAETAAQIDEARAKALAAYQSALTKLGSDAAVEARIQAIQTPAAAAPGATPQ